ncbi:MAG: hypothetical protein R3B09_35825 [Nannocystaceae bacterium]
MRTLPSPPRRSRPLAALAALCGLVIGLGLGACFEGEFLAYAPCDASPPCHDAGLVGCVRAPEAPDLAGFCAPECSTRCPKALSGDASPMCVTLDGAQVCVLSCAGDVTCPDGMVCARVRDQEDASRDLCFPEAT